MKKNDVTKDLLLFKRVLKKVWSENIVTLKPLDDAHEECQSFEENNTNKWSYEVSKSSPLTFKNIDLERNSIPHGLKGKDVTLKLWINLKGDIAKSKKEAKEIKDYITSLGVNFGISGSVEGTPYLCHWHLDMHSATDSNFTHPHYHFHFGGGEMDENKKLFGNLLFTKSPRVTHHPLDIILATDFVIRNFYTLKRHKELTENTPEYTALLRKATARFLKPYFTSIASNWHSVLPTSTTPSKFIFHL